MSPDVRAPAIVPKLRWRVERMRQRMRRTNGYHGGDSIYNRCWPGGWNGNSGLGRSSRPGPGRSETTGYEKGRKFDWADVDHDRGSVRRGQRPDAPGESRRLDALIRWQDAQWLGLGGGAGRGRPARR